MNVLILTPDRVGSTLLQRLLTIYMLRRGFNKPVINLHELTNGLVKYYHTDLNQDVLGKPEGTEWGYYQSLPEIQELLDSADHYKTSRLAHYHIVNRKDSIADQIKFYDYLNKNFHIISCRRENVLEHALSWAIQAHSKKLNVYSPQEKITAFADIYQQGITVNQIALTNYLNKYKQYIEWADSYFNIQDYFNYEQSVDNLEDYILNLSFMHGAKNCSWVDMFGQSWKSYNTVHRMIPNLMLTKQEPTEETINITPIFLPKTEYNNFRGDSWPELGDASYTNVASLPESVQQELKSKFGVSDAYTKPWQVTVSHSAAKFIQANLESYKDITSQIIGLVDSGFMVTGIPIKLQSLKEKQSIIQNFDDCVIWYNQWVEENGIGKPYTIDELMALSYSEEQKLDEPVRSLLNDKSK